MIADDSQQIQPKGIRDHGNDDRGGRVDAAAGRRPNIVAA
jgi:hypothetical protein